MNDCYGQLIPTTATAGLSFALTLGLSEYPAPLWSATLHLRGPSVINLPSTPAGMGQQIDAAAVDTAMWAPGLYWYALRMTCATAVRDIETGRISIAPDFASLPAGYDGRTQNEVALDAICAVLAKRATQDQQRYTIGDRELWRSTPAELLKLKASFSVAVRRERAAKSGRRHFGRAIQVRFSD